MFLLYYSIISQQQEHHEQVFVLCFSFRFRFFLLLYPFFFVCFSFLTFLQFFFVFSFVVVFVLISPLPTPFGEVRSISTNQLPSRPKKDKPTLFFLRAPAWNGRRRGTFRTAKTRCRGFLMRAWTFLGGFRDAA